MLLNPNGDLPVDWIFESLQKRYSQRDQSLLDVPTPPTGHLFGIYRPGYDTRERPPFSPDRRLQVSG
jgi:hypothetical protein